MNCLKSMEYHQIQQMKKVQDAQRQHSAALQLANDHEDNNNGGHGVETIPVTVELVAENQTCAICLDDLNIQHHLIGLAHCKHVFCFTCLANYQKHSNVNEPLIRGAGASGTTGNANGNANDEYIAPPDHEGLPTDQEMMEWHERQIQNEVQGNGGGRPDPTSSTSTSKCPCCRTNMPDLRSLYLNRISITLAQMANMTSMTTTTTTTTTQESLWKRAEQYMKALESLKETKVNLQVMKLKAKGIYLMGNYTVSLQHYQELVDKCQEQIQRREELMELHQQWQMQRILASTLSQREEVIRSFRKLQKELVKGLPVLSESDVIDVRLEMNSVRMAMGQWTETISSLKQVIRDAGDELTPNQYRRIFMAFSKCLFETQQYALAIDAGQAGVEMNRFFPGVYTYIGKSHLALGNIKLANQAFCCAVHYEAPWDEDHRMKTQEQYDVFRSEVDFDDEEEEE
jgi:tetratricopeptide (TPR) repeat protein